jgi:hypothetical protein
MERSLLKKIEMVTGIIMTLGHYTGPTAWTLDMDRFQ